MKQKLSLVQVVKFIHNYRYHLLFTDNLDLVETLNNEYLAPGHLVYELDISDSIVLSESIQYQLNGRYVLSDTLTFNQSFLTGRVLNEPVGQNVTFIDTTSHILTSQHTMTTAQDGDWSDPATWVGGIIPDIDDAAIVNHDVVITEDVVVGDDTVSTVLDVTNGTLTIDGVSLTLRGNAIFGKPNSGTTVYRLIIINDGDILNGATVIPVITLDEDTGIQIIGPTTYDVP